MTVHSTRSVRMPAALAASTLPPMAYRDRPKLVKPRTTMPIAKRIRQTQTEAGIPSHSVVPR